MKSYGEIRWKRIILGEELYGYRQLIWDKFGIMKGKPENKNSLEGQKSQGQVVQGGVLHMETEGRGWERAQESITKMKILKILERQEMNQIKIASESRGRDQAA